MSPNSAAGVGGPAPSQQCHFVTGKPGPFSRELLERRQRSAARGLVDGFSLLNEWLPILEDPFAGL